MGIYIVKINGTNQVCTYKVHNQDSKRTIQPLITVNRKPYLETSLREIRIKNKHINNNLLRTL